MMCDNLSQAGFQEAFNVSRETMERLQIYAGLLEKWNPAINLVSKTSLKQVWARHFVDSAQIFDLASEKSGHWLDIGSGGGFPGLVVAIVAAEQAPDLRFTFIESDLRKCAFLEAVSRDTNIPVTILPERIENVDPQKADILSARALAPLKDLLVFAERHLKPGGQALFSKGASYRQEMQEALETWAFRSEECSSKTDDAAVILSLGDIRRV